MDQRDLATATHRLARTIGDLVRRRAAVGVVQVLNTASVAQGRVEGLFGNQRITVLVRQGMAIGVGDFIYARPVGDGVTRAWVYQQHVADRTPSVRSLGMPGAGLTSLNFETDLAGTVPVSQLPPVARTEQRVETFYPTGSQSVFALAQTPVFGTQQVKRNGLDQHQSSSSTANDRDYWIGDRTITMTTALSTSEVLAVVYDYVPPA